MTFDIMFYVSMGIAAVSFVVCLRFQIRYFCDNKRKLDGLRLLFPVSGKAYSLKEAKDTKAICVEGDALQTLVGELNEYSLKNVGTTDFAIIQNKTERYVKMQYDDAVAKLAFPTYCGLMGTFVGVFLGLFFFALGGLSGGSLDNDDKVYQLIWGVLVSMSTSFVGLFLTTWSNAIAADTKKELDKRKNTFYDFIQNDMMPAMGTSMVVALTKLRETLGTFEPAFNRIIGSFKTTFDECTRNFGNNFQTTVNTVTNAAQTLGNSIQAVNDNVRQQRELLNEIRSGEMMLSLNSFLEACDALEDSSKSLKDFMDAVKTVENNTHTLIESQRKYNSSLIVPQTIVEKLNAILDRITTFEDSINNLGTVLDQTELVSNRTINSIEAHLQSIQAKNDLSAAYLDMSNDKLNDLMEDHRKAMEDLFNCYHTLLAKHEANLAHAIDSVDEEMMKARNILISKLSNAFDLISLQGEFAHLERLPEIKKALDGLQSWASSLPGKLDKHIDKGFGALESLQSAVGRNGSMLNAGIEKVSKQVEAEAQSISRLSSAVDKHSAETTKMAEETSKRMDSEFRSVGSMMEGLSNSLSSIVSSLMADASKKNEKLIAIGEQIDKTESYVKRLVKFNEDNPVQRMDASSIAKVSKLIDAQREKLDSIRRNVDSCDKRLADMPEIKKLEDRLRNLSSAIEHMMPRTILPGERPQPLPIRVTNKFDISKKDGKK